ncbi:NAD(P)-binding protein [Rhizodiscina lignyota]|uniref:NAD(P)-binding protein n=1 Tax=Rhizodiscina lignyota TaxID=1504668 RepID=A0A9P4M8Y9_9PEZI|nr:NAD(P)-binding protein [Rhizodiscina lignyota]
MVVVAVAGGTGHVGRTLVDGLIAGGHDVYVLGRKPSAVFDHLPSVRVLVVSYDDQDDLRKTFEEHKIEIILCTFGAPFPGVFERQIRLIRAAAEADAVKRFAPTEWLVDYEKDDEYASPQEPGEHEVSCRLKIIWKSFQQDTVKELRKHPSIEWTLFHNGYFMDYFGQPYALTYMPSEVPFVDIEACKAAIPGTGEERVVFTHSTDMAKFVSRAIGMKPGSWKEHSWIIGDKVTFHEIVATAEKARGVKFDVAYDPLEKLREGKVTRIPANDAHIAHYSTEKFDATDVILGMFAGLGTAMALGDLDIKEEDALNANFPDIKTVKLVAFIEKYWTGRQPQDPKL